MSKATMVSFGCLDDENMHYLGQASSELYNALKERFNPQETAQILVLMHVMLFKWNSTVANDTDFYLDKYNKAFKDALDSMFTSEVDIDDQTSKSVQ